LVLGLALLIAIAMACVVLFRMIASPGARFARPMPPSDAERILRDRFARGEIDIEEFRARLDALHGRPGSPGSPGSPGTTSPGP
jgi:putative membrane protein